jgi:activator of HSP90 ATPase
MADDQQQNIMLNIFYERGPMRAHDRCSVANILGGKMKDGKNIAAPAGWPTRRQMIFGAAVAFGGLTLRPPEAGAQAEGEISRTEESIHQETTFKASRKRVYEALTETQQFEKITQLSAEMLAGKSYGTKATQISREVGGAFTLFGGHIVGRQVELAPNERIVQAWRVVDWDPGKYSIAKFELVEQGAGTKIVFDHTGFPKGDAEHLAVGWRAHYWETLEKYLA